MCIPATHSMHEFKIMETQEIEQTLLGWTRSNTGKGDPTYHPVENANCVTACKRDNTQNYVKEVAACSMKSRDKDNPTGVRTANNGNFAQRIEEGTEDVSHTVTTVAKDCMVKEKSKSVRIRRLTERELFRLMDVDEGDIDTLLSAGIAKTQLAKMAGNSIVVACLYYIFKNLYIEREPQEGMQTKLF